MLTKREESKVVLRIRTRRLNIFFCDTSITNADHQYILECMSVSTLRKFHHKLSYFTVIQHIMNDNRSITFIIFIATK